MPEIEEIYRGMKFRMFFILNTKADVYPELDKLEQSDENEAKKAFALIQRVGDYGPPRNIEKCRLTSFSKIFELKTTRVRIPFFYHPHGIVLTHLFFKGTPKEQNRELKYADDLRRKFD